MYNTLMYYIDFICVLNIFHDNIQVHDLIQL